jgi:chemotaxis protein methyltransferase CheR
MGELLGTNGAREFAFTTSDFDRVRTLIHARAGISLAAHKRDMVYSRLARRIRHHGLASFAEYLDALDRLDETQAFVNALTTNLTSFFREAHHFDALRAYVRACGTPAGLRVWSAAASTGEEPYSIAITLAEAYGSASPPVDILASDIDTDVLAAAARAIYELPRLDDMSRDRVAKYFQRGVGENTGLARVVPSVARLVRFRQISLLDAATWPDGNAFDAIFCRNVLIYFDRTAQARVIERLHARLKPGGLLMLGHSESLREGAARFASLGRTIYRKIDPAARASA